MMKQGRCSCQIFFGGVSAFDERDSLRAAIEQAGVEGVDTLMLMGHGYENGSFGASEREASSTTIGPVVSSFCSVRQHHLGGLDVLLYRQPLPKSTTLRCVTAPMALHDPSHTTDTCYFFFLFFACALFRG